MIKPPMGPTDPLAGVMEAKPAMQPVTAPTKEDFPNLTLTSLLKWKDNIEARWEARSEKG